MKSKFFTLLTLLLCLCSSGAWASTTSDLTAISSDYIFIADNVTSNGTAGLTGGTLYDSGRILSVGGNSAATNKGSSTIAESSHLNSLRIKGNQNQLAFKVSGACTITFYNQGHSSRYLQAGTTSWGSELGKASVNTTSWELDLTSLTEPTVIYLSSYAPTNDDKSQADMYIAGFVVQFASSKVATPTCSLGAWDTGTGKYAVTLSCGTVGATIKYSTDNKANYSDYSSALALAPGTTLDAYAVKDGLDDSDHMTQYTVPAAPTVFTISFDKGDGSGVVPAAKENVESGSVITLPKNFTLYKAGYTMTGWDADGNGTADYTPGQSYTVTADKTLTAVYAENTVTLAESVSPVTIKWWLGQQNGLPDFTIGEGSTGFVVTQAMVNGEKNDVKLDIDCNGSTKGKFHPGSNQWGQVNNGTIFTIPSANGAVITYNDYNNNVNPAVVAVQTVNVEEEGNTYVHTVSESNHFYEYIQVVLPAAVTVEAVSNKTWNMGDFTEQTFSANAILDNIEFASGVQIASNTKSYLPEFTATKCAKLPKSGSTTANYIHFKVAGPSLITVYAMSAKNNEARNITIYAGESLLSTSASGEELGKFTANYTGNSEKDVYIYTTNTNGQVSVYGILVNNILVKPANDWSTYVTTAAMDFGNVTGGDMKAYVATAATGGKVSLSPVTTVPTGTPLLLIGTAGTTYTVPVAASASAPETNMFRAGDGTTEFDGTTYDYLLYTDGKFYQIGSGTIATNKAYLHCDNDPTAGASRALTITFDDDELTGIKSIESVKLNAEGEYFDLQGRRVAQPTKGLYIVNGKKVIIK